MDDDVRTECGPLVVFGLQYPNAVPGLRHLHESESWTSRIPNFNFSLEEMVFAFQHPTSQPSSFMVAKRCSAVWDLFNDLDCNSHTFVETTLHGLCHDMPLTKRLLLLESLASLIQSSIGEQGTDRCMIAECICQTIHQNVSQLSDASFLALVMTRDLLYDSNESTWFKIKSRRFHVELQDQESDAKGDASPEPDVWEGVPQDEIVPLSRTPTDAPRPHRRSQSNLANRTLFGNNSCVEDNADYDTDFHGAHSQDSLPKLHRVFHDAGFEDSADDTDDGHGTHDSYSQNGDESLLTLSPF